MVTAQGSERVWLAALIATEADTAATALLIYRTHVDRGYGNHRRKGFAEADYARPLDGAHQELAGPIVLVRDNLPTLCAVRAAGVFVVYAPPGAIGDRRLRTPECRGG